MPHSENEPRTERDLGRVEGKLDLMLQRFTSFEDKMEARDKVGDTKHSKLADRVTALEKKVLVALISGSSGVAAYAFDAKHMILGLFH